MIQPRINFILMILPHPIHIWSAQILHNQLLPNSGPHPPILIMCTETVTFDVDNATKNYKRIIDLGPFKGSGVGNDYGAA